MSNDIDEDMKNKISTKYKEITQKDTITDFCEQKGISESTFHKYKNHEQKIEKNNDKTNDFENDYKPDKKEKPENEEPEDEEPEDEEPEDVELIIG